MKYEHIQDVITMEDWAVIDQWTRSVVAAEQRLAAALQSAVDANPWVTKYKAQGDFGLPLTGNGSNDPLVW